MTDQPDFTVGETIVHPAHGVGQIERIGTETIAGEPIGVIEIALQDRHLRVKVPFAGRWREVLNSDSAYYGGSDVGNSGGVATSGDLVPELRLTIPPLAAIFLQLES